SPHNSALSSMNFETNTGMVGALVPVRINANKKSFQASIKLKTLVAANPGKDKRKAIL
ncbi:unnamed protein product, partial [marine sediment metagenome]